MSGSREKLAGANEQTGVAKARLATLLKEVRQAKQDLKDQVTEARKLARTVTRAQQTLNAARGHQFARRVRERGAE
jgi:hypothetical protein